MVVKKIITKSKFVHFIFSKLNIIVVLMILKNLKNPLSRFFLFDKAFSRFRRLFVRQILTLNGYT